MIQTPWLDRAGELAVIDLFRLAACNTVVMTLNYTTFSIAAALIGGKPLEYLGVATGSLVHAYFPCFGIACTDTSASYMFRPFVTS